jgi:hypothetical protein
LCAQAAEECSGVQVVDECPLAVDLDHRQPFAVLRLQFGDAADVDFAQVELVLAP